MCGICGFIPLNADAVPHTHLIEKMCIPLRHRGPDDTGIYTSSGVGLGHQRLKVIDLVSGQQPMLDQSGNYALVFNGEVYNYVELKHELQCKGYVFVSQSDTEVLLYGLIDQGLDFLNKINGMFTFSFWNKKEKALIIARDRLGIKPLYYAQEDDGIYFASEASSIACVNPHLAKINQENTSIFLALSYIPGENSIFSRIKKLEPGSYLKIIKGKLVKHEKWWNILTQWECSRTQRYSENLWHEKFAECLENSVKIRLKADVPLGVFLSSGIDSAVIASLVAKHLPQTTSFTMAFADPSHNEAPYARKTAEIIGTKHYESTADLGGIEQLLEVVKTLDEPFGDTSMIPMQALCGLAKKHVTVALTGDGADELLGGYITHRASELYKTLSYAPAFLIKLLRMLALQLPDSHRKVNAIFKLKQFLSAYPREKHLAHACWRLLLYPEQTEKIFPELSPLPDVFYSFQKAWDESRGLPELDRLLFIDYKTWFAYDILFKADRASMHKSLELRSPFLDYNLFNLCAGMPTELKRKNGRGKVVLRDLAAQLLPSSCLNRPKVGFNAPVATWLTTQWKDLSEECFSKEHLNAVGLQHEPIIEMWKKHKTGWNNYGLQLFNVFILVLWNKHRIK